MLLMLFMLDYVSVCGLVARHSIMCKYTDDIEWEQETDRLNDVYITGLYLM